MNRVIVAVLVAVALVGCGGSVADQTEVAVDSTEVADAFEEAGFSTSRERPEVPNDHTLDLLEPISLEFGSVTVTCDQVTIQPIDDLGDFFGSDLILDTTRSVVILTGLTVTNDSADIIQFIPNNGTIVLDGVQYDVGGVYGGEQIGEVLDGAAMTANILYELPVEADDVLAAGSLRLLIDMTYAIGVPADDLDLDLSWSEPEEDE